MEIERKCKTFREKDLFLGVERILFKGILRREAKNDGILLSNSFKEIQYFF